VVLRYYKVIDVDYLDGYKVAVYFDDGVKAVVDFEEDIKPGTVFEKISDPTIFKEKMVVHNDTLTWDVADGDETKMIDISPEYLREFV
jgi:hypothetical protein